MMEWVLILNLLTGPVTLPRPFPSEEACIGAGEKALPQCVAGIGIFRDVEQVCLPRRFICVAQPRRVLPLQRLVK